MRQMEVGKMEIIFKRYIDEENDIAEEKTVYADILSVECVNGVGCWVAKMTSEEFGETKHFPLDDGWEVDRLYSD